MPVITNVREAIFNAIPLPLKRGVSVGIGLFIAFIGLQKAGLAVDSSTLVTITNFTEDFHTHGICALLAVIGLFITAILYIRNVKGSILLGILATRSRRSCTSWLRCSSANTFSCKRKSSKQKPPVPENTDGSFSDIFLLPFLSPDGSFLSVLLRIVYDRSRQSFYKIPLIAQHFLYLFQYSLGSGLHCMEMIAFCDVHQR